MQWIERNASVAPDFNGPVDVPFQRFEQEWIEQPIFTLFCRTADLHADRIALTDGSRQLTYAQVLEQVKRLAERIARHAGNTPVGIMLNPDVHFPIAALACLAAGRAYIPVDLKYPAARIADIFDEAGSTLAIAQIAPAQACLPARTSLLLLSNDDGGQPDNTFAQDQAQRDPDGPIAPQQFDVSAPAVILYTSGSTGRPKGICNNQRALLQRVCEATNSSHMNPSDRVLLLSSPGTIAGEREMFAALLNGAALTLCDPQRDGLHGVLKTLEERQITLCYMVPALFRMLLRSPGAAAALAHLRVLRIGGDITLSSDLQLFRQVAPPACHFLASFSATEMPAVFQWFVPRNWQPDGPRVPVGYPRPEVDFCAVDQEGNPAAPGEFAELVVRSRYLALGLWQAGRLQPGGFTTDPDDPSLRILHSGDMVRARSDGLWELTGRKDRQIKIHGQRVDIGEVEELLRSHAGVEDVVVSARQQGEETVALVAFVASAQPQPLLQEALRAMLAQRLPGYMRPAQIHLLPAIPQLPGFKPDMAALQQLDQASRQSIDAGRGHEASPDSAAGPPPRAQQAAAGPACSAAMQHVAGKPGRAASGSAVRQVVQRAWSRVLGAHSYRLDLPFDESGGDSLKALELWFHVEEALGFKLGLEAMRIGSRPSELENALLRAMADPSPAAPAAADDSDRPLIYLMPGILGDDPLQLRFRAAFGDSVRFRLIDYPGWRQMIAGNCHFDTIVDAAFQQVRADGPQPAYRLAGYSFGGIVAYELARRLVAAGYKVDLVALLDSRRWDVAEERPLWQPDQMLPELRLSSRLLAPVITFLVRERAYALLTAGCTMLTRHANRLAFRFRNRMTKDLRFEALRRWQAQPLQAPVTLFLSSDQWPGEPEGYGWQDLCDDLTMVHVGGTHASMIDKPGRETIAVHIQQALRKRMAAVPATGLQGRRETA
ncbi:AMP-binding protein [Lacisediminimonas sp.]|uniref:AMP-binding protein n=1 Tax=Lacisediminimonas sp. TaxID=3060582 RepID=UPI002724A401|nr:AMP-binding protein [Lacisediminimonas sp.]MDO8300922.1 AMP-binding protein [Lacisediminimonas sp.]